MYPHNIPALQIHAIHAKTENSCRENPHRTLPPPLVEILRNLEPAFRRSRPQDIGPTRRQSEKEEAYTNVLFLDRIG